MTDEQDKRGHAEFIADLDAALRSGVAAARARLAALPTDTERTTAALHVCRELVALLDTLHALIAARQLARCSR